jgi:hypothetical protein
MQDCKWEPLSTQTINGIADRLARRKRFWNAEKPRAHPTYAGQLLRLQNYMAAMERYTEMGGTPDGRHALWFEVSMASDLSLSVQARRQQEQEANHGED